MAKDNKQIATDVLVAVGGKGNVLNAQHCMTRLRITPKDMASIDDEKVKAVKGVLGVNRAGTQYQVIIGQNVGQVYDEFTKLAEVAAEAAVDENLDAPAEKEPFSWKKLGGSILDYMSSCMVPMIPAIMVAGLFKAVESIFGPSVLGIITEDSGIYFVLDMVYNAGMYFIPIFLGYNAAKKLGMEPVLGALVAAALIAPDFVALSDAGGTLDFLGINVPVHNYSQTVIPVMLAVAFMNIFYQFFKKHLPQAINSIFTPFLSVLVSFPIILIVLAPLASELGDIIGNVFYTLGSTGGIVSIVALGVLVAVQPFLVITGMHITVAMLGLAVMMQTGAEGFSLVANGMSNWTLWAIALAYALKTKDPDTKAEYMGAFISGVIGGVVEPTLYGINIPHPKSFRGAVIGGACAGVFAAITQVQAVVAGGGSNPLMLLGYISPDKPMNFVFAALTGVIGFVVSFLVTYFTGFDKEADPAQATE